MINTVHHSSSLSSNEAQLKLISVAYVLSRLSSVRAHFNAAQMMTSRAPSCLAQRMSEARNGDQDQGQRRQQDRRRVRVEGNTKGRHHSQSSKQGSEFNPVRENSPLLSTSAGWAQEPQPDDWDYAGPDVDDYATEVRGWITCAQEFIIASFCRAYVAFSRTSQGQVILMFSPV